MSEQELTNAIVKHILVKLGIFREGKHSIMAKELVLKQTIPFIDEEGKDRSAKVWACSSNVQTHKFHIMCCDLTVKSALEIENTEVAVLIKLEGVPTYGCYMEAEKPDFEDIWDAMIACTVPKNSEKFKNMKVSDKELIWMPTTIFLQATFLAGMEQLKDLGVVFNKMPELEIETHLNDLKSFLKWRELFVEEEEE